MFLMQDHGKVVKVLTDTQLDELLFRAAAELQLARIVIARNYATIGHLSTPDHECFIFRKVPYYGDN